MPVPTVITDLSTTIATNSPAGSEDRTTADDYLRALSAFIAQLEANKAALASAPTFTGLVKARGGGLGLGRITVSSSAPSGLATGDWWAQY